ncbi:hypothetical protein ENKNEFLB_02830 [Nocardioides aquaticus]|uniref:Uncharacterized protein n=1 Tax=Nocardioides aquaticus TaxID=160826 RepID=A0ABX8EKP4_9ACTN|nr:hypothetical protein [Nocardioides aquaticus]QVT80435.1 hypothetical protein ENKNEFLB_02830 [Nocardioides aquaticus]
MNGRGDIAAAASSVPGIIGHEYVVGETDPGTVYPRLDRIEYPNAFGGVAHWNVVLVLPQDLAEAERYAEDTLPVLKAALDPHLVITAVLLQRLQLDGVGTLPVAFINGHREADLS